MRMERCECDHTICRDLNFPDFLQSITVSEILLLSYVKRNCPAADSEEEDKVTVCQCNNINSHRISLYSNNDHPVRETGLGWGGLGG